MRERAYDMGLINAVVRRHELLDEAFRFAARITKNAPLAVQATKRSVLEGLKLDMREAFRNEAKIAQEIFMTEDAKEGPRAFDEKRDPQLAGPLIGGRYQPSRAPLRHAALHPDKPAVVFPVDRRVAARTPSSNRRSNQIAHLLRARGLKPGDGIAVLMPNQRRLVRHRVGGVSGRALRHTDQLAPDAAEKRRTSSRTAVRGRCLPLRRLADTIDRRSATPSTGVEIRISVDGDLPGFEPLDAAIADQPGEPRSPMSAKAAGCSTAPARPGAERHQTAAAADRARRRRIRSRCCSVGLYGFTRDAVYLSPAPLYHAAPAGWSSGTPAARRHGRRDGPLRSARVPVADRAAQGHAHSGRPHPPDPAAEAHRRRSAPVRPVEPAVRSSMPQRRAPPEIKRAAIEWLGPDRLRVLRRQRRHRLLRDQLAGMARTSRAPSASRCSAAYTSSTRTAHELPIGEEGEIWFEALHRFDYHGDPEKTAKRSTTRAGTRSATSAGSTRTATST